MSSNIAYVAFCMDDGQALVVIRCYIPEIKHCYVVIPNDGEWLALGKSTEGIELMMVDNMRCRRERYSDKIESVLGPNVGYLC